MANNLLLTTAKTEYIRGLETGLSWFREMMDYEVETDVEGMTEFIPHILGLIEADYLERLEKEKAGLLNG